MKSLTRWDPFRALGRWDPFEELRTMQHEMDKMFNRFFGREEVQPWTPSMECYTKDNLLVFRAELPGMDPKDLDISVTERELIIKGERKAEKGTKEEDYVYKEINYGSFERHFVLPEGAKTDDLKAKYANGILEITVPAPAISKGRKIEIEAPKEEKKMIGAEAKKAA